MITVLLIDDDEDEFILFAEALNRLDKCLKCIHATSAGSGLELLEKFSPAYIYVDMNMPITTGLECIRRIRGIKGQQKTPIIIYSASLDKEQWENAKAIGVNGFLQKTGNLSILVDAMLAFFIKFNRTFFFS